MTDGRRGERFKTAPFPFSLEGCKGTIALLPGNDGGEG